VTLNSFKDLLLSVDPRLKKWGRNCEDNYTVWSPHTPLYQNGDNSPILSGWRIQVDRFTKIDNDTVVDLIRCALSSSDDIAFAQRATDFEPDTGFFHFIFDVEVAL